MRRSATELHHSLRHSGGIRTPDLLTHCAKRTAQPVRTARSARYSRGESNPEARRPRVLNALRLPISSQEYGGDAGIRTRIAQLARLAGSRYAHIPKFIAL